MKMQHSPECYGVFLLFYCYALKLIFNINCSLITAEFEQYIFRTFHSLREEFDKPTLPVLSGMLVYFSGRCLFVFDCALSVFVESFF